jgi:3-oxoacyl-[acyl-carrier protein] reductase
MSQLNGKVAIVTGASKGIGAAIAERLASDGAAVVVNYGRSAKEAEAVAAGIKAKGGRAVAIQADISKLTDIKALFEKTVAEFGKVDILVNNAGVYDFLPLANVSEDHFDKQFDLNVKGLVFASQEAVRVFGDNGGSIINISSVVSTSPMPNASVYSATKAAVDAVTKSLAAELGPKKILVNSILPGATETEGFTAMPGSVDFAKYLISQTPLGRLGKPEDIASTVAFLASPDAAWITGQLITVSGGLR